MRYYYGWNIVAACILFQAVIVGLGSYCFTFWVMPWLGEFGASRSEIMLAVTASFVVMGALSPLIGWAMDRRSVGSFVCAGAVLFGLGFVLISQASAIWQILLIYALFISAATTLSGPMAGQILSAKWFNARRGLAIGLVSTGASTGGLLLPPVVAMLLTSVGWRHAHLVLAVLPILVAIPLAWFVIRNTPAEKGIEAEQVNPDSTQLRSSHFVQPWNTATILRDRGFQVIAVSFVPPTVAFYGILQNLAPYAHDLGYTAETSASFMSMIGGSTVVGKILFGGLADRFDKRYLFWLAIAGLATAMSIMAEGPSNSWLMLFVSALIGLTTGSLLPLMGAFVGDRFSPSEFGRVMGLLYPFIAMSSVGALIAGWMRDQFGAYGPAFWIYVLLLIPAALIMAVLPEPPNEGSLAAEVPQGHS